MITVAIGFGIIITVGVTAAAVYDAIAVRFDR